MTNSQDPADKCTPSKSSRLGAIIRKSRESRGWSLAEAADIIGISKQHLHNMESAPTCNPTFTTIAALVVVYGIRPEAIVAAAITDRD